MSSQVWARNLRAGNPMSRDADFAGSIPAIYEQYLVRPLFEPYARDLARRLANVQSGVVLELAAGTGVVTRTLAATLLPQVRIIATDLNQDMLARAASHSASARVQFQQADAQRLPFEDATADVVLAQFGVMFFPDKVAAHREVLRVLRPTGHYLFNVWDRLEANEASQIVAQVVAAEFPDDPPAFIERTPFGYWDVAAIRADLTAAGFERISIETMRTVSAPSSVAEFAIGLCTGTPLRREIEMRAASRLEEISAACVRALQARFGTGDFENPMSAHIVSAWRGA